MSEVEHVDSTTDTAATVDLDGAQHQLAWPRDQTLVDVMLDAGIHVPHSCREGHCGSCVATVISGRVEMAQCDILEADDLADGLILGCQARPVSNHVHIEF
jgi:ferredoxin